MPDRPYISISPDMKAGRPCVGQSRFLVEDLALIWATGNYSIESLELNWPGLLNKDAVLLACWYQATYGKLRWRKAWGGWAEMHGHRSLWAAPLPHQFMSGRLTPEEQEKKEREEKERHIAAVKAETLRCWEIDSEGEAA